MPSFFNDQMKKLTRRKSKIKMENKQLKELINDIAKDERLYGLLIGSRKVGISKIKQVIRTIFKKYETYNALGDSLICSIIDSMDVDVKKFDTAEKEKMKAFNEYLQSKVMHKYYSIIDKNSIHRLTIFLIENKVEFFENELICGYDEINCSDYILDIIVCEAISNATANIEVNSKVDYYNKYIYELNSSLQGHLKKE